jgi:chromosome partitioning protein
MITIAITNAKGGVAKTTTALCVSSFLAEQGQRTLVLDIDPQANASKSLLELEIGEAVEAPTMQDVLYQYIMEKRNNITKSAIRPIRENLFLLPAALGMEQFKDLVKSHSKRPMEVLKNLVKPIEKQFDYLVIDCPADLSIYVENAIELADYILCPSTYDFYGIDGLSLLIPTIQEIKGDEFEDYRVLYTLFNSRATKIQAKLKEYADALDEELGKVLPFQIPIDQSIKNSQADNSDIMTSKSYKNTNARHAYEKLGHFVLENWN